MDPVNEESDVFTVKVGPRTLKTDTTATPIEKDSPMRPMDTICFSHWTNNK